jgi:hypothetical protein
MDLETDRECFLFWPLQFSVHLIQRQIVSSANTVLLRNLELTAYSKTEVRAAEVWVMEPILESTAVYLTTLS